MKVLWIGDLAQTGFGTVTREIGLGLLGAGHDVRFVSQNDLGELEEPFRSRSLELSYFEHGVEGVTDVREFVPRLFAGETLEQPLATGEPWGAWKPDTAVLLGDFYGVRDLLRVVGPEPFRTLPSIHYVPIEGTDLPPSWREVWDVVKPVAMSKFGQGEIERVTGVRPPLVYHGVDSETFRPVSASDPLVIEFAALEDGQEPRRSVLRSKAACKHWWGLSPAVQVMLRTDRFMPRKGYPALLRALAPVLAERPFSVLVLHCKSIDYGGDLIDLLSKLPPDVRHRVIVPDFGPLPRGALAALYNAADLYVSTSAEGFGLTIAEALACGVPAVALDYSAVPEVVGDCGLLVPVGRVLDNEYAHNWALPDEAEFGRRAAYLLDRDKKRLALGEGGPRHIRQNFSWAVAAERTAAILEAAVESAASVDDFTSPAPQAPFTPQAGPFEEAVA